MLRRETVPGKSEPCSRRSTQLILSLVVTVCLACTIAETEDEAASLVETEEFKQYWFAGKAELVRFELEQARYGEIHRGDAVLIFVTEDFLPDKQVKSDSTNRARSGALPVLKLNLTRKFNTGLYPYSMMTSVFTPLDLDSRAHALKTSTTVQEWCGHTYLQLNLRSGVYRVQSRSYFESEADRDYELPEAWLEDEIWTRIRLAPESLPVGELQMIPGAQQSRLLHRPLEVEQVIATLESRDGDQTYALEYPSSGRRLAIRFTAAFPHEILGWEETRVGGPGALTTRAVRTHTLLTDYWSKNRNADTSLGRELGLD